MRIIISKLIKLPWNCLINCNLQDNDRILRNLSIFNLSIFAKSVPFLFKLARKGAKGTLAWKKGTPFCKIEMFKKKHHFVILRSCNVVLSWFYNIFEKYVVGCPSFMKGIARHIFQKVVRSPKKTYKVRTATKCYFSSIRILQNVFICSQPAELFLPFLASLE